MGGVLARIQDDKELTAIKRHSKRKHMEHYRLDINDLAYTYIHLIDDISSGNRGYALLFAV